MCAAAVSLRRICQGIGGALLVAAALSATGAVSLAEEAQPPRAYLRGIQDLPLMRELTELEETSVVFDKPAGRIVISLAQGEVSEADVLDFYASTLPQLGWTLEGKATFHREGEVLRIEFEVDDKPLRVHFSLSPN
jgi:hypothetical protein